MLCAKSCSMNLLWHKHTVSSSTSYLHSVFYSESQIWLLLLLWSRRLATCCSPEGGSLVWRRTGSAAVAGWTWFWSDTPTWSTASLRKAQSLLLVLLSVCVPYCMHCNYWSTVFTLHYVYLLSTYSIIMFDTTVPLPQHRSDQAWHPRHAARDQSGCVLHCWWRAPSQFSWFVSPCLGGLILYSCSFHFTITHLIWLALHAGSHLIPCLSLCSQYGRADAGVSDVRDATWMVLQHWGCAVLWGTALSGTELHPLHRGLLASARLVKKQVFMVIKQPYWKPTLFW